MYLHNHRLLSSAVNHHIGFISELYYDMQLASSSLTGMVSGNANPHGTDADHLCRSHDRLWLKPSRLMHMIGDDDDGDRDRDAKMMAEHDGELVMAMTVALT